MTIADWFSRHSNAIGLTLAFICGTATATSVFLTIGTVRRRIATEELKNSIPQLSEDHYALQLNEYGAPLGPNLSSKEDERASKLAARARRGEYDEDLILEQLARNRVFLTDAGLQKLRDSFVVVVGLGGVGSHCVAALARSGVSKIRIIDFDQVTLSSLNRHALATLADVGTPKVHTVRKRLEHICPWIRIECKNELFNSASAERLLSPWGFGSHSNDDDRRPPDFVVDAIDNIDSKVDLLHYCAVHELKIISSMGAGCKSDPTRICVGDISATSEDALSKSTRRRLKLLGVKEGLPVVFSTEKPGEGKAELLPISEAEFEKGQVGDLSVLPDFRVRILPVLGTMPAVFGYTAANYVICSIAGYPMEYRVGDKGRDKMYDGMLAALHGLEERLARLVDGADTMGLRIPVTKDDICYLTEEIFRGKSVVSGLSTRLAFVRWRKPANGFKVNETYEGQKLVAMHLKELVLMTREEALGHEKAVLKGDKQPEDLYEPETLDTVQRRLREEEVFDRYR